MDTMRSNAFRLGLLGCLLSIGAVAAQAISLQAVLDQQTALKADLADGGIEGLTPRQNAQVARDQGEVFALATGKASWDAMTIEEKVRVENALERINALVLNTRRSAGNKQTCWREKKLGSKTTITRCATQDELDAAREGGRAWMERPKVCIPPGCGT